MFDHQRLRNHLPCESIVPDRLLAWVMMAACISALLALPPAYAGPSPADAALFARLDGDGNDRLTGQEIPSEHKRLFDRLLRKADANRDQALSRDEFIAGLAPTQPEKPLEEKQSAEYPGADATRWLLLSMDTDGDSSITEGEVPANLRPAFETMTSQIDRNQNKTIERNELSQGGRQLSNLATRFAAQLQVDVEAELAKLEQSQGAAYERFDGQRGRQPAPVPNNPQPPRQVFTRWDANSDGQLVAAEVPAAERATFRQLLQVADRDGNGRLSEQEFLAGYRQIAGRRGGPRAGQRGAAARGRRGRPQSVIDAVQPTGADKAEAGMEGQGMDAMSAGDGMTAPDR
jgi:hypothetical protein